MSTGPKTLVADIERLPGRFSAKRRGLTVSGDFWSLSDHKHLIGRISPDEVTEWPSTICIAWRFIGKKRVEFASVWDNVADAEYRMLERFWVATNEADIVVGHNFKAFDMKHLRTAWRDHGFDPPAEPAIVDTLSVARSEFGDESRQLVALTKRLGISTKTDKYSVAVARAAVAGDRKAQQKLRAYNAGDVEASEALYLALRPWMKNHPSIGLYSEDGVDQCSCGSREFGKNGFAYTKLSKFQRYYCRGCGATFRGKRALASADLRRVA